MSFNLITPIQEPDDIAHRDGLLMHELSVLTTRLSRYVIRYLDADAGRVSPVPTTDEHALADHLATAADAVRSRANRRNQDKAP